MEIYRHEQFYLVEPLTSEHESTYVLARGEPNDAAFNFLENSQTLAATLREAINRSGVHDDATPIIAAFYETGEVSQNDLLAFDKLITGLDPQIDNVFHALSEQVDKDPKVDRLLDDTCEAAAALDWQHFRLINRSGLSAEIHNDGLMIETRIEDIPDMWGLRSPEGITAQQLGLTVAALQHELVWRDSEPHLLSNREHASLGRIAADGTFEPVVTILDISHLVRSV